MSEIYSILMLENGIKYSVFFFGSFSGHFHPWTPIYPLSIDEIGRSLSKYDKTTYYQGWYSETPKGPRLDKLLKFMLYKAPMNIDIELSNVPGVYHHRLEKVAGVWVVKEPLTPELLIKQENYFRYVVNKDGELEFAYRIYATPMWNIEYTYKKNGALDNFINKPFDLPERMPD